MDTGDHLAAALPFLPDLALAGILAHLAPDRLHIHFRVRLLDLFREPCLDGLVGIQGYLMLPLDLRQLVFFRAEEARALDGVALRGLSMGSPCEGMANTFRPTSTPTSCPVGGSGVGSPSQTMLTDNADTPLAGRGTADSGRLRGAFERAMQDDLDAAHLDAAHLGQTQSGVCRMLAIQRAADRSWWKSEAVVATRPPKARVAGVLTCLQPPEEGIKGFLEAQRHILQDLRVDVAPSGRRSGMGAPPP